VTKIKKVGTINHYFDKIGVAVMILSGNLSKGDLIKISGHDKEFTQEVTSMQIEHEELETAKKGLEIGLKVNEKVKEGDQVFLVNK